MKNVDETSKELAKKLFGSKELEGFEIGTAKGLKQIHEYLFGGLYDRLQDPSPFLPKWLSTFVQLCKAKQNEIEQATGAGSREAMTAALKLIGNIVYQGFWLKSQAADYPRGLVYISSYPNREQQESEVLLMFESDPRDVGLYPSSPFAGVSALHFGDNEGVSHYEKRRKDKVSKPHINLTCGDPTGNKNYG